MSWKSLKKLAYTPYSEKKSACIVESKSGQFYSGVRIENISFPLTIPATQAACTICLSEGEIPAKIYVENTDADQLDFWAKEFGLEIIETQKPPIQNLANLFHSEEQNFNSSSRLNTLLEQAITPNSNFPVSALLFVEGGYFEGVNIEVSDWSQGICAERVVIAKAIAAGFSEFKQLEIHTQKGEVSSPCGACRQVISELLPYHDIKLHHADGSLSEHLSVDLLPFSFKSESLKLKK